MIGGGVWLTYSVRNYSGERSGVIEGVGGQCGVLAWEGDCPPPPWVIINSNSPQYATLNTPTANPTNQLRAPTYPVRSFCCLQI